MDPNYFIQYAPFLLYYYMLPYHDPCPIVKLEPETEKINIEGTQLKKQQEDCIAATKIKIIRNARTIKYDDNWDPKKMYKYKNKKCCEQKQDRNTVSNIIRCFLKIIFSSQGEQEFNKIKEITKQSTTIKQFREWLEKFSVNHRNYVRMQTIIKLLNKAQGEQIKHARVLVILFSHFQTNIRVHFLTSLKLKQNSRTFVIKKIRDIHKEIISAVHYMN